jgi:hypothetical protein
MTKGAGCGTRTRSAWGADPEKWGLSCLHTKHDRAQAGRLDVSLSRTWFPAMSMLAGEHGDVQRDEPRITDDAIVYQASLSRANATAWSEGAFCI